MFTPYMENLGQHYEQHPILVLSTGDSLGSNQRVYIQKIQEENLTSYISLPFMTKFLSLILLMLRKNINKYRQKLPIQNYRTAIPGNIRFSFFNSIYTIVFCFIAKINFGQ